MSVSRIGLRSSSSSLYLPYREPYIFLTNVPALSRLYFFHNWLFDNFKPSLYVFTSCESFHVTQKQSTPKGNNVDGFHKGHQQYLGRSKDFSHHVRFQGLPLRSSDTFLYFCMMGALPTSVWTFLYLPPELRGCCLMYPSLPCRESCPPLLSASWPWDSCGQCWCSVCQSAQWAEHSECCDHRGSDLQPGKWHSFRCFCFLAFNRRATAPSTCAEHIYVSDILPFWVLNKWQKPRPSSWQCCRCWITAGHFGVVPSCNLLQPDVLFVLCTVTVFGSRFS